MLRHRSRIGLTMYCICHFCTMYVPTTIYEIGPCATFGKTNFILVYVNKSVKVKDRYSHVKKALLLNRYSLTFIELWCAITNVLNRCELCNGI